MSKENKNEAYWENIIHLERRFDCFQYRIQLLESKLTELSKIVEGYKSSVNELAMKQCEYEMRRKQ